MRLPPSSARCSPRADPRGCPNRPDADRSVSGSVGARAAASLCAPVLAGRPPREASPMFGNQLDRTHRRGRRLAWPVLAAAVLALALPLSASAAGKGALVVTGIQEQYGSCVMAGYGDGYKMDGNLDGCWVIMTFDTPGQDGSKSHLRGVGTERFEGTI